MARRKYRNPFPTVDIIIEVARPGGRTGIVLVRRRNPPPGWAIPGGFVDYGETLEAAAVREAREETALDVELLGQLHTYSDPARDPRKHTISTVFVARAEGKPRAGDDARLVRIVDPARRGLRLAFDHDKILDDYVRFKRGTFPWTKKPRKNRRTARTATSRNSAGSGARSKPI